MRNKILLAALFLVFGIGIISFASATFQCNDFTSKWNYCGLMSISGQNCDNFWQNASDCSNPSNTTITFNESNFYSKAQIDSMFANFTIVNGTNGNNSLIIYGNFSSGFVSSEVFDAFKNSTNNAFAGFVTNATYSADLYQLRSPYNNQGNQQNYTPLIVIMSILVFGLIVIVLFMTFKKKPETINRISSREIMPQTGTKKIREGRREEK